MARQNPQAEPPADATEQVQPIELTEAQVDPNATQAALGSDGSEPNPVAQPTPSAATPKGKAKAKDYEISKPVHGNLVCQQCGEQRRTNENGVFCPANDPECPRYADV